jgi:predicted RNA-binding Zn ribbon-like protein
MTAGSTGASKPAFEFGGRLSLDLTWTLRYRAIYPTELLATPEDLRRWLTAAALPVPRWCFESDVDAARSLREAIYSSAKAVISGHPVIADARDLINECAARPPPWPVLAPDGSQHTGAAKGRETQAALSAVSRDAIEILTAHDGRLRRCDGPGCSLLFYDDSRPGVRRWCATSRCGNKVNTKAYRTRRHPDDSSARR